MKRVLILTGQLRFNNIDSFNNFTETIEGYDVFISTTREFEAFALKITSKENIVFLDDYMDKRYKVTQYNHIYQWMHLDLIIHEFKYKLLQYDVIYRIRTDIKFNIIKLMEILIEKETMYSYRDILFFAETEHFIKTFENFYNDIFTVYMGNTDKYIPLNYSNIMRLENNHNITRFHWLIFPKIIWDSNFNKLKENIQKYIFDEKIVDINNLEMKVNVSIGRAFTSEKSFVINCLEHGLLKGIRLRIELFKDRFEYKNFK